jgi:hypothetical protein
VDRQITRWVNGECVHGRITRWMDYECANRRLTSGKMTSEQIGRLNELITSGRTDESIGG